MEGGTSSTIWYVQLMSYWTKLYIKQWRRIWIIYYFWEYKTRIHAKFYLVWFGSHSENIDRFSKSKRSSVEKINTQHYFWLKMVPLFTIRQALTWMCVYPAEKTAKWRTKITYISFSFGIILMIGSLIITSLIYIFENITLDFEKALFAALQFCGGIELMYTILSAFNLRQKIVHIFEGLSHICDACKIPFRTVNQDNGCAMCIFITFVRI